MPVKISQLPTASLVTSDDLFPLVDSGSLTTQKASAQQVLNYITGSTFNILNVNGNANISGNLIVDGRITAQEFYTENISASIIFESGSTKFGNDSSDTHEFSGSVLVSGTLNVNNTITGINGQFTTVSGSTGLFNIQTSSNALFTGDIRVLGTASIGQLNTVNQTSLVIGDKYITILSGGVDHTGINGAGFLWGTSSGPGETTGALGEHAHILYDASRDALKIFPGLYVTGNTTLFGISGTTAQFTTITASSIVSSTARFTTLTASNANISGNLVIDGPVNLAQFPDYAYVLYTASFDKIVVYPGLYVSGNLTGSGLGAFQTLSASTYIGVPVTSPGGTNTTIQFNSGSTFSGSANLVYNYSNRNLILTGAFSHFTSSGILSYIATSTDVAGGVTYNFGQGIAGQNGSFWYRNSSAGVGGLANNSQFWIFSDTGASSGLLLSAIGTTAPIIFSQGGYTSNNERLRISNTEVVSNNPNQSINFRVGASGQSNALFVQGSTGRVGIGTNTPGSSLSNIPSLDVVTAGDTKILARTTGGAGAAAFVLQSTGHTSNPYMEFQLVPSSTDGESYVRYNYVGATTKESILTIQSNSRVGINKISPNSTLDINGNTIISGNLTVTGSTVFGSSSTTNHQFSGSVNISGTLTATAKSFDIVHPTRDGMRLRYGSLEGPENGVYVRGVATNNIIELPEHWTGLVHEDSITVNLTPLGSSQDIWVDKVENNKVYIGGNLNKCYFTIFGERKDISKLVVEY